MDEKGFTLIEIVAIILVLLCIFMFSFPQLLNMMKTDNDDIYNNMVDNLCTAGKTYMYSNMDKYPELSVKNEVINLKVSTLIDYGNVEKNLKNPKTELSVEHDYLKYTVLDDFSLKCEYKEKILNE